MFEEPRYMQSTVSLIFPDHRGVHLRERQIYNRLRGRYFPAKLLQSADGNDSEGPALVFQSQHGHSQILITGATATLSVVYSDDWQIQPLLGREYVVERAHLLFEIRKVLDEEQPLFCGSVTRVRLPALASVADDQLASFLARQFTLEGGSDPIHDFNVKTTSVVQDRYFNNMTVQNYRSWTLGPTAQSALRLSRERASERGIEVIGDFNSRYSFNEDKSLKVTKELVSNIVELNLTTVGQTVQRLTEAGS